MSSTPSRQGNGRIASVRNWPFTSRPAPCAATWRTWRRPCGPIRRRLGRRRAFLRPAPRGACRNAGPARSHSAGVEAHRRSLRARRCLSRLRSSGAIGRLGWTWIRQVPSDPRLVQSLGRGTGVSTRPVARRGTVHARRHYPCRALPRALGRVRTRKVPGEEAAESISS